MKIDVLFKNTITNIGDLKNTVIVLKVTTDSLDEYHEVFTIQELPDECVDSLVNRKFTYYHGNSIAYSNIRYSYDELVESFYDSDYNGDIDWIHI